MDRFEGGGVAFYWNFLNNWKLIVSFLTGKVWPEGSMWFDFYLNLFGERGGRRNLKLSWCNYTHRLGFQ